MLIGGGLGLRALPFADVTCATSATRGTFSSFELTWVRYMVLPYRWLDTKI